MINLRKQVPELRAFPTSRGNLLIANGLLYKNTVNNFSTATQVGQIDKAFLDTDADVDYYYWVVDKGVPSNPVFMKALLSFAQIEAIINSSTGYKDGLRKIVELVINR